MRQGKTHLYYGNGKGKTTAALGLLLRAYGNGMQTVLVQFLKGRPTGELQSLAQLPDITILRQTHNFGLFSRATTEQKEEIKANNNALMKKAWQLVADGLCDLLILDEICAAYNNEALEKSLVEKILREKPPELELVLTGRNAPELFYEHADYVTEFVKHKHPFDQGLAAREGIEF